MNTPDHHHVVEWRAIKFNAEIAEFARQARERINRSFGQITRYTLARIELAKREYGVSK